MPVSSLNSRSPSSPLAPLLQAVKACPQELGLSGTCQQVPLISGGPCWLGAMQSRRGAPCDYCYTQAPGPAPRGPSLLPPWPHAIHMTLFSAQPACVTAKVHRKLWQLCIPQHREIMYSLRHDQSLELSVEHDSGRGEYIPGGMEAPQEEINPVPANRPLPPHTQRV